MKIVLVHGIFEREGATNMSVLWPYLQRHLPGMTVELFSYGFFGLLRARFGNARVARRLADAVDPGDIVITHSNGAAITYLAVRDYGMQPFGIVNINPALDRWRTSAVAWVDTIHSRGDRVVWWSQWLPCHLWGDQGKVGYRGLEDNTDNIDASAMTGDMRYEGHMGLFAQVRVGLWASYIAQRIEERIEDAAQWKREGDKLRALFDSIKSQEITA